MVKEMAIVGGGRVGTAPPNQGPSQNDYEYNLIRTKMLNYQRSFQNP